MEHYEFISSAVSFGYVSAKKGKKVKMFKKYDNEKVGKITQEEKEREKQYIESIFVKKVNPIRIHLFIFIEMR